MLKKFIVLFCILTIGTACKRQEDIRGTFVNNDLEEITINCDFIIESSKLSGQPFMPNNGDEIKLSSSSLQQEDITISYMWDSILSPFGVWSPSKDELSIGSTIYARKNFVPCE
jgi:hypothetical protein